MQLPYPGHFPQSEADSERTIRGNLAMREGRG